MPKALIVGAGINGLCTAWGLVRAGWQVEIFEAGQVPDPKAASTDHHRLIRQFYTNPHYASRITTAFGAWERLWKDLGCSHYYPRGVLALSRNPGDWTEHSANTLKARNIGLQKLTKAELSQSFPMLETDHLRYGILSKDGGVLMANDILADLAVWLLSKGAILHTLTPVIAVSSEATLKTATGKTCSGDIVVSATGVASGRFHPGFTDCHARRVVTLYLDPPSHWRRAWAQAPCWSDLGGDDDLWGIPPLKNLPMKLGYGRHTRPGDPQTERHVTPEDIEAIRGAYRGRFKDMDSFILRDAQVNFYLMAPKECFRLHQDGRHLALSADSGHGFKFGALTGEDMAQAIVSGDIKSARQRLSGDDQ